MTQTDSTAPQARAGQPATGAASAKPPGCSLVWLRRDLRLADHAALAQALQFDAPVQLVFVFDADILDSIPADLSALIHAPSQRPRAKPAATRPIRQDRRVAFIHQAVSEIAVRMEQAGAHLMVRHGRPVDCIPELAAALGAQRVVFAHDDEPAARTRDAGVTEALQRQGIAAISVKDQCIFERSEVLTGAGRPFSVFTPYKNAWLKRLTDSDVAEHETGAGPASAKTLGARLAKRLLPAQSLPAALRQPIPALSELGFGPGNLDQLKIPQAESGAQDLLEDFLPRMGAYKIARDFPAAKGPSYLSVHLRFGTVSIRELVRHARAIERKAADREGAATWLSELIWRDFYMQILYHHPHVVNASFRPEYDAVKWEDGARSDAHFAAWCAGQTGYPLVDAGMRQLNATGYMHNRLRMVTASFLTKDLGIHWRRGEDYFAWKLNDFDLSANNGGWQWAASTGCDAQPYFRIFNPVTQSERFDPKGQFIRRYVPELAALDDRYLHAPWTAPPLALQAAGIRLGTDYPLPIVEHDQARQATLARFAAAKKGA